MWRCGERGGDEGDILLWDHLLMFDVGTVIVPYCRLESGVGNGSLKKKISGPLPFMLLSYTVYLRSTVLVLYSISL
jgi:hypothetical protein